jgi:hypothetical protein
VSLLPTVAEICAKAAEIKFGEPLVVNTDRGFVAEVIVGQALGAEWRWLARDFTGWDFQHETGCRLEVKHSAARQTWGSHKASAPSFDIKARTGYWDNDSQRGSPRRDATPTSMFSRTIRSLTKAPTIKTPASGGSMSYRPSSSRRTYRRPRRSAWAR